MYAEYVALIRAWRYSSGFSSVMGPPGNARMKKSALRQHLRSVREALNAEEHTRRSGAIVRRLKGLPEVRKAACVHVYWPMIHRSEVDLRPLIAWLYAHKKQIVLPVVLGGPGSETDMSLAHHRYEGADALVRNRLGIDEPLHAESVPVHALDVVIVPALGVDRAGNRIGYGRGHYDRFLREVSVPRICPVYRDCLLDHLEPEAHDVPVDIIVTEDEVLRVEQL